MLYCFFFRNISVYYRYFMALWYITTMIFVAWDFSVPFMYNTTVYFVHQLLFVCAAFLLLNPSSVLQCHCIYLTLTSIPQQFFCLGHSPSDGKWYNEHFWGSHRFTLRSDNFLLSLTSYHAYFVINLILNRMSPHKKLPLYGQQTPPYASKCTWEDDTQNTSLEQIFTIS